MGRKVGKRQRSANKLKNKQNRIKKIEKMNAKGLSRKRHKFVMSVKKITVLKLGLAVLTVGIYFLYSPLLFVCMLGFIGLYFADIAVERNLNKSFIKKNQIKIPKYESGIALVLVLIAIFGTAFGLRGQIRGGFSRFGNRFLSNIISSVKNFGTLFTGERSILGNGGFLFGVKRPPSDFPTGGGASSMPISTGRPSGNFMLSAEDLPLEFMFSSMLSSLITVLIFTTVVLTVVSVLHMHWKIKKTKQVNDEFIIDEKIGLFLNKSDILERIVNYGVIDQEKGEYIDEKN